MSKTVLHIAEAAGGVERYLLTLLKKSKKSALFNHVMVCSDTYNQEKFTGLVSDVIVVHSMKNAINFKDDLKSIFEIRKIIKSVKPDIIYCHSSKAGAVGRIADIGLNNKLVYNAHGWAFNMKMVSSKKINAYKIIEKILAVFTDKIVCISEYEFKSAIVNNICKKNKLVIINNGIDLDENTNYEKSNRTKLGIPIDSFVVGCIGRISAQKAPDTFVKMASIVKNNIPNSFFVMVGDGDQLEMISSKIKRENLDDRFLITGWIDNSADYANCFDVATLLSRWEGFGLVLPEYMRSNIPIVGTKADAIPYVLGDAGILVDIDDYQSAANAVINLYNNKELRDTIVRNEKARLKIFDSQRMADETIELFHLLLNDDYKRV